MAQFCFIVKTPPCCASVWRHLSTLLSISAISLPSMGEKYIEIAHELKGNKKRKVLFLSFNEVAVFVLFLFFFFLRKAIDQKIIFLQCGVICSSKSFFFLFTFISYLIPFLFFLRADLTINSWFQVPTHFSFAASSLRSSSVKWDGRNFYWGQWFLLLIAYNLALKCANPNWIFDVTVF